MPNYSKILKESRNAQEAIDKWKSQNNRVIDGATEASFRNEPASSFKGGSTMSSGDEEVSGTISSPYDVLKAGRGRSTISEMSGQYKVKTDDLGGFNVEIEILKQLKRESDLHTEINEKMGITGELSRVFRDTLLDTVPKAASLNYDMGNIAEMVTQLSANTGKFNLIAERTLERSFETARAFGLTLPQLADAMSEFEKVGYGASDTLKKINKAGIDTLSLGLNSKKLTQELKDNIGKLNEYGFANGVAGLNRMVQKATEFRMNIAESFKLADKVMNPESAIELTANMQMLGGAIGDLNDPLKLMYMATNNVEGLQDALHGAAAGLATYNKEQGKFEIVGANLRRAKEMASQLGISYQEFAKGAVAANERIAAGEALASKGFNIKDDEKEFLTNLAQMKDGEMQIVIPKSLEDSLGKELGGEKEIKLSQLTKDQIDKLVQYQEQLENKTAEELARDMFNSSKNIELYTQQTTLALTKYGKDITLGKNERPDGPLESLSRLQAKGGKLKADLISNNPEFLKNLFEETFGQAFQGTNGLINAVKMGFSGLTIAGESLVQKLEQYIKNTPNEKYDKKVKEEEKWNESSKVKDRRVTFNNNLKITHVGLGDGTISDITKTEKGYLTGYDDWG
jgi:hypothetical protein